MSNWFRSPGEQQYRSEWSVRLDRHARWLRTVIAARSGELAAIDEVFQEVALAIVKQKTIIPEERVAPWLYKIAVRQSLLYRRRLGRERKLRTGFAQRQSADRGFVAAPLAWLLSDERQRLVRFALSRLNAKDAELLMLKYTEDWSYRDLADHLGVTEGAIETRLHRARQRLRTELTALEVIETES